MSEAAKQPRIPRWRGFNLTEMTHSDGIVDSQRSDVPYEPFRGHSLDRKMLDLLVAHCWGQLRVVGSTYVRTTTLTARIRPSAW